MLKIYNTLTRKKEEFVPIKEGKVTMYSCGPTVYSYAHIGNLRTYVFMDLVRRVLSYDGFKLKGVMNITDVGHLLSDADSGEDKMVKASREQRKTPWEIADYYSTIFFKDIDALNIKKPEVIAKATDHIEDMIKFVKVLIEKGYAYETSDGIYYDIAKFKDYGKLSGISLDDQLSGARVEVNDEKRHPADFALWKKAEPAHIMQWESPWGMGYPGWHIECSVMSKKYLGDVFDIHSGGVDHIPIHHENEIAQNEAYSDKKCTNYWMHGEFMLVDNGKMSKSLGNVYTLSQLKEMGYEPLDFRYFCLNAHYRKKLNFTFEGLTAAKTARERLNEALIHHKAGAAQTPPETLEQYQKAFEDAIDDDINIPLALGVLFTMIKEPKSKDIYKLALKMDSVFGLSLDKVQEPKTEVFEIPNEIQALVGQRDAAKKNKDYARADEIRKEALALGYQIIDTKEGAAVKKI